MKRTLSLVALAAATLTTLALPTAAEAVPGIANSYIATQARSFAFGTGCTINDQGTAFSYELPVNAGTTTRTQNRTATVTDGTGKKISAVNAVTLSGSASTRNGQLSALDVRGTGSSELNPEVGQTCGASAASYGDTSLEFTLTRPQWMTVSVATGRLTSAWMDLYRDDDDHAVYFDDKATASSFTSTHYLPAGKYYLEAGIGWETDLAAGQAAVKRGGSGSISLRLSEPGSAPAAAVGNGRGYFVLGAQTNCSTLTVPARFTSAGWRVRSASILVNGVLRRTVRNPNAGQTVTVPGLGRYRTNTVQVRLNVDPPGSVRTAYLNVRRSYRACLPAA